MDLPLFADQLLRTGLPARLFALARDEDLGERGDVSSLVSIDPGAVLIARVEARQNATLAGLAFAQGLADAVGNGTVIEPIAHDGQTVSAGDPIALLRGPARDVLAVERPLLNLLGRLSGIATLTAQAVARVKGTRAHVCDTRKTTPGLRVLEKYAVVCGGGTSHRMGLFDAVMLKDNHLAAMSREGEALEVLVERAARAAREQWGDDLKFVQIECDTLEQFASVLRVPEGLVDLVLLDNMDTDLLGQAVAMRGDALIGLEASGGITLDTLADVAATGIDRVSLGQLTTQATGIDFGLDHEHTIAVRTPEPPLEAWADVIEAGLANTHAFMASRVVVVAHTASTQDVARSMASDDQCVVVIAGEQTAGRGRLGRAWHDAPSCSLAMSIVFPADSAQRPHSDLLGIVGGLALCTAAHQLIPGYAHNDWRCVALRWPNDAVHVASGRKLGGVLVESTPSHMIVGLGMNVGQLSTRNDWPGALASQAVSLAELGASCSRLEAAVAVLRALNELLTLSRGEILECARAANALQGTRCAFIHDTKHYQGVVGAIDPDGSIELTLDDDKAIHLPAATTSLVHEAE